MKKALILGGTGQIGIAVSKRLQLAGWSVLTTSRSEPVIKSTTPHRILDASNAALLKEALLKPTDLLVSCIAFDKQDALNMLMASKNVGRIIAISSASVYQDQKGRTLDEARENGFPQFDGPIAEETKTVSPEPQTYSTRKVDMENTLREQQKVPVSILRPCAVHGPYSKHAREWWFVKRFLDGRKQIPLAYGGKSRFQTTSVNAIADAVLNAAENLAPVVSNVADADSPSVMQIGETIRSIMGSEAEFVPLSGNGYPPTAGVTPWSIPEPFVVSSKMPGKLSYAESVERGVTWLVNEIHKNDWTHQLPQLAAYPYAHFDYFGDDAALNLTRR